MGDGGGFVSGRREARVGLIDERAGGTDVCPQGAVGRDARVGSSGRVDQLLSAVRDRGGRGSDAEDTGVYPGTTGRRWVVDGYREILVHTSTYWYMIAAALTDSSRLQQAAAALTQAPSRMASQTARQTGKKTERSREEQPARFVPLFVFPPSSHLTVPVLASLHANHRPIHRTPPKMPDVHPRRLSDPLTAALQPPPDESPAARDARLAHEREAKKVSDGIDELLRQEREARKAKLRMRKEIKVLLLGQSESGKSTTLKQFQLAYTPNAFREERLAWRAVVYLNLLRSVRRIIDALIPPESPTPSFTGLIEDDSDPVSPSDTSPTPSAPSPAIPRSSSTYARRPSIPPAPVFATAPYIDLRNRLEPLFALEETLIKQLAAGDDDEATQLPIAWRPGEAGVVGANGGAASNGTGDSRSGSMTPTQPPPSRKVEVSVNTRNNWKRALGKLAGASKNDSATSASSYAADPSDPVHVLAACRADIERLWGDETVRAELRRRRMRLEESSGFYLDSIPRITSLNYIPSDDDVLKARLKTLGVVEHTFALETGKEKGVDWKIYDVGGARSQRHAWMPYFEDVNAIIFIAPISAFDQVLAEDPRVNRVEDSLLLWRSLVANKLLANVNIILFLNKCDLLQMKLEAGVQLNQYMTSYGDRPNDHEAVSKYFRSKFLALSQTYSPNPSREVYLHLTAVTDTRRTSSIITNVRDIILRDDLRGVKLL